MSDPDENTYCWRCGYSLCGFDEDEVCPECGLTVLIARQEAPLVFRSWAQKWTGILALVSVVPFILLGFVSYLAATFAFINHETGMYGAVVSFTFASMTGVAAGWFMKVPKRAFSAPTLASLSLFLLMFLWLWPLRILFANSVIVTNWMFVHNVTFLTLTVCVLGSLAIQAKSFARKTGMPEPTSRAISFSQISYLAFVSAGLMALGGVLKVGTNLIPLPDRLPGLSIGLGMLLGVLPFGIWVICLCPIIYRLARWPIGEIEKSLPTETL